MTIDFDIGDTHPSSPHLFADLAELLLLTGLNGRTSLHANDLESLISHGNISVDEIDEEEDADKAEKSSAESHSRRDRQIEDVFSQLGYRSSAFNAFYPFAVRRETLLFETPLSDEQRLYRFMLACSRLRSFGRGGLPQRWAKGFAKVSQAALRGLLPEYATTRIFDANSDDRQSHYGSDLRCALKKLGAELGVLSINEDECQKVVSSGDAGLDLIASVNLDDGAATAFAVLGQCGAQEKDWPKKTLEAHPMNLRHFFQMQWNYPSAMFTPVCYRDADGAWVDNKSANGVFLADRSRILTLIAKQNDVAKIVSAPWFGEFEAEFAQFIDAR